MRQIDHGSITLSRNRSAVLESVWCTSCEAMLELWSECWLVCSQYTGWRRWCLCLPQKEKSQSGQAGIGRGWCGEGRWGRNDGNNAGRQAGSKNCDWFVYLYNSSQAQLETGRHTHTHAYMCVCVCVVKIYTICCGFGLVALFGFGAFHFIDLKKWKIYV